MEAPTAADLRADRARVQLDLYVLAARVGVHPGRLGSMLRGKLPMSADVAERVAAALRDERERESVGR